MWEGEPLPYNIVHFNRLFVRRFFISVRVQMGGMMWASSPTDKALIRGLEFSFYQTVAFAVGGGTPPLRWGSLILALKLRIN